MGSVSNSHYDTPMMRQYRALKASYPDCLLMYRLGDFYELFLEDAIVGSQILNITLTSRDRGKDGRIPMAGVPYHAADNYISRLTQAGYKVAIAEQVSDANAGKLVDRKVVRIITPGINLLDSNSNGLDEYIYALVFNKNQVGIAATKATSDEIMCLDIPYNRLDAILSNLHTFYPASEIVICETDYHSAKILRQLDKLNSNVVNFIHAKSYINTSHEFLKDKLNIPHLNIFSSLSNDPRIEAVAVLEGYFEYTQRQDRISNRLIIEFPQAQKTVLNQTTLTNLEMFQTLKTKSKKESLIGVIDKTDTPLGKRCLTSWLKNPLTSKEEIEQRQQVIKYFINNFPNQVTDQLKKISDVEKNISRIEFDLANVKDLYQLKTSLAVIIKIHQEFGQLSLPTKISKDNIQRLIKLSQVLAQTLLDNPKTDPKSGGFIDPSSHSKLATLSKDLENNKQWLSSLEKQYKSEFNIPTLKVGFNKVFGYYIEISKQHQAKLPDQFIRKQTLVNAERYNSPELQAKEAQILSVQEQVKELEFQIFLELKQLIIEHNSQIREISKWIGEFDTLLGLAKLATEFSYCQPTFNTQNVLKLSAARHPVLEQILDSEFVPNSIELDSKSKQMIILTGPNMAGKSVLMRQVALTSILAQIGSFVPATMANLPIYDQIFVRSGASDQISHGLSTFMVEMVETSNILANVSSNSLVIMDEIGRGTSTYDGISLAWAIASYLVSAPQKQAHTLFATHYHELQELASKHDSIFNYQMAIDQSGAKPVFLYTLIPGASGNSFGLNVARIAGLPENLINQAQQILSTLRSSDTKTNFDAKAEVLGELASFDLEQSTPMQAWQLLTNLKQKLKDDQN